MLHTLVNYAMFSERFMCIASIRLFKNPCIAYTVGNRSELSSRAAGMGVKE